MKNKQVELENIQSLLIRKGEKIDELKYKIVELQESIRATKEVSTEIDDLIRQVKREL